MCCAGLRAIRLACSMAAMGNGVAAYLILANRRAWSTLREQIQPQTIVPDLWLLCAPVKRTRLEIIAEKAAELGVREIHPVITEYTNAPRVNMDRLAAITIEAAEQCGLVSIPKMQAPEKLHAVLDNWPPERKFYFAINPEQAERRWPVCRLPRQT